MSVFEHLGGAIPRFFERSRFLRGILRPALGLVRPSEVESDLARRLLAGLLRDHPLSHDPVALAPLRRVRGLLRPVLAPRLIPFHPVCAQLPNALGMALPAGFVVVSPGWLRERDASYKGLVFHVAFLLALSLLRDSYHRSHALSIHAIPPAQEILNRLAAPPRVTDIIFKADRMALDFCQAAGFGPDSALDALAMPCCEQYGPVSAPARIQHLRNLLSPGP